MILHYFLNVRCGGSEEGGTETVVEAGQTSFETRSAITQYRSQLLQTLYDRTLRRVSHQSLTLLNFVSQLTLGLSSSLIVPAASFQSVETADNSLKNECNDLTVYPPHQLHLDPNLNDYSPRLSPSPLSTPSPAL